MRKPDPIQRVLRSHYQTKMQAARLLTTAELERPAMIFAPHPDDESLACGGTILRKAQAGAAMKIVFMTDGSASHAAYMSPDLLRVTRMEEAQAACAKLGVSKEDVFFLGFEDQHLTICQEEAARKVLTLLEQFRPAEVFIPFRRDPPPDHSAAHRSVLAALELLREPTTVNEYPVWFWYHWPWVALRQGRREDSLAVARLTLRTVFGARAAGFFNASVDIQPVIANKRAALAEHRSQMTPLLRDTPWPTLESVSQGEFLDRFFQNREYFYRYSING